MARNNLNNLISNSYANSLSIWLFIYAFCFSFFYIVPDRLYSPLLKNICCIITPIVLSCLIYRLYKVLKNISPEDSHVVGKLDIKIILFFGIITLINGHAIYLTSKAFSHLLHPPEGSQLFYLDYFYDEIYCHLLRDAGILIISIGFIVCGFFLLKPKEFSPKSYFIILGAICFGFTNFVNVLEGGTIFYIIPIVILIVIVSLYVAHRRKMSIVKNQILSFFLLSYIIFLGISGVYLSLQLLRT